ncbi:uncharacterized protein JCM6883_001016 [Sporobolomyces salmoneus]|uniref:uncharacterized protein n=1 Tax=Sporobolomyces salmoneus TaxID=183962 RepID=UPI00316DB132
MIPPDYPRLPHSYRLQRSEIKNVSESISGTSSTTRLRAAAALVLAAHAGEDRYTFAVEEGQAVEGELDRDAKEGKENLLSEVGQAKPLEGDEKMRLQVIESDGGNKDQRTPLQLVPDAKNLKLSLNYDSFLLTDLEARWFLSHISTAYDSLHGSPDSAPLSSIKLAPSSESSSLAKLSRAPPPPQAYPDDCTTLPSFVLNAAKLYSGDPALHFAPSPDFSSSEDFILSFSQLVHLSRFLAQSLLASVSDKVSASPCDYVVPLCIDKSPEMILSMVAISLAGFGYLALEPSWPEGRKKTILSELSKEGKLAGVGIVQSTEGESEKWKNWKLAEGDDRPLLSNVVDPRQVLRDLKSINLETLEEDYPIKEREWISPRPDGIAYVIYTSGTTGVPKGIEVQHRNVAAFLRNYRDVFGRARGERVLQFPSYSFDVSVMNIWDTLAHGATVCVTSPSSLFSDLAGSILRLNCTLVDLTPTISSLLFEHAEAQPREGETAKQAWERAGFRIKQVNTGGEKVEKAVRERWRERGVRVVIDYGPTETTVGVVSNQSLDPTPSNGLPIGRPTGLTRIHILSTSSISPVPLGCIGEICVTGEQVTPGYIRKQLNEGVFFDLNDEQAKLLGIESDRKEERRLYRTGDLGRWLADEEGNIECLGRKDGQVKVNGLRIEIGEIEEHLSAKTNPAIVRGIVDKFETDNIAPSLVAFLELSPPYLSQHNATSPEDASNLVHPFTSSSEFIDLTSTLSKALGEKVPHYMVPRYWLAVSRIPTAGMGKADRKTLRGLAEKHDFRSRRSQKSRGTEKKQEKPQTNDKYHAAARKAWARVLKLDEQEIGDDDGFTELGGDSIRFMRIVSVLRSDGWHVGFRQLGEARKLGECAAVLRESESQNSAVNGNGANQEQVYKPFSLIQADLVEPLLQELTSSNDSRLSRSSISDIYPTAPSQDALLAPSFDSPVGHYYAQAIYSVKTDIETSKLEEAIERLIERHEVLRTVFVLPETLGTTAQVVLAKEDEQVKRASKVKRVEVERESEWDSTVSSWLSSDRERFAFKWGQLHVSFAIFSDEAGTRKLGWGLHHAMSDGWTLELLTADLRALCYDLDLPSRPPFSSFVSWWSSEREPPSSTAELWRSQLSGAKPLHWPSQDPLNGEMLATTAAAIFHWTGDLSGLSQRNGITPAIASRLATSLALAHHADSKDVTLGIVRSGRDIDVDLADTMIGPCVSVLPSRLVLPPSSSTADSPSLLSLAESETRSDRLARLNQRVTLSDLARICSLPGRTDLFDILVTFQSLAELDSSEETLAPWPIRQPPERIHMPTNYTLSFEFTPEKDEPDKLELACYFDERIIGKKQVEGVLGTVAQVLDYLTTAPCTKVDELKLGETAPRIEKKKKKEPSSQSGGVSISKEERSKLAPIVSKLKKEWFSVLRLDESEFGDEETFGSLGGDSISTMRLAVRLSKVGLAIPTQSLAKLPTLLQQAKWLNDKGNQ